MTAILGGLGAALLWAAATLCSSRSSRMLGSRVVLGWVILVGFVVGLPIAIASPGPTSIEPSTVGLLALAGVCYVVGLQATYAALRIGKVSIVAPIVSTEGAVAAVIAVALGDPVSLAAAAMLGVIVVGVVLSSLEPGRVDVAAGDFDLVTDALEGPTGAAAAADAGRAKVQAVDDAAATRRAAILAIVAAGLFGVGLVATGRAAVLLPVTWVALSARVVGMIVVVAPLLLQRRLTLTRAALPLVVIAGTGELFGSMLSAWGSRESIAIAAVIGSQFAAIAAVAAYFLFGERIGRLQTAGVIVIIAGVTALAAIQA